MSDLFTQMGPWGWLSLGGVLLILEMAAPGVFFIWLGLAAMAVGLISFAADLSWQIDVALFAVLSVAFLLLVRPWYQRQNSAASDRPNLNNRMFDHIGRSYALDEAITNGRGKIRVDDTLWDALGPDLPKGARVTVTGVEGVRFRVDAG